jgi:hypothetical protein
MNDWYMQLGLSHCQRDASAADGSRTRQDRDRAQITETHRRWPGIVSAIRTLARRYNDGAGREVLTVIDNADGHSDALVVTIVASGAQTLRVAVNGAELCVRPTPTAIGAADDGQRWITFGATDGAIAAYALQDWLAHL